MTFLVEEVMVILGIENWGCWWSVSKGVHVVVFGQGSGKWRGEGWATVRWGRFLCQWYCSEFWMDSLQMATSQIEELSSSAVGLE